VWRIGLDGSIRECLRIEEAIFLNGLTPLRPGTALTVDSLLGAIYEIDLKGRTARRWFQHEQLTKCSDEPMLPGVNGIKVFGDKVFVTNTDRALILEIPINPDGSADDIKVVAEGLRGCDDGPIDTLLVVGGLDVWTGRDEPGLLDWVRDAARRSRRFGSICMVPSYSLRPDS
jgi:hypothetical protein